MAHPNLQLLVEAAKLLIPLLDDLVFVGGCATVLLIDDPAGTGVRPTIDVDAICNITSYADYLRLSKRLRSLGLAEDMREGAPMCRWRHGQLTIDVMPVDETILGFSNRWYKGVIATAQIYVLEPDLRIRAVSAPYFCATKIEAFKGRGNGDYLCSQDLEDLVTVIDGRREILAEIRTAPKDVRAAIASAIAQLLENPSFVDAIPGYLPPDPVSQERFGIVFEKLREIAVVV